MERLRVVNLLAEEQVASLKHTVHIGMIEALGIMREGKSMADYAFHNDFAKGMLDELVWWANTPKAKPGGTTPSACRLLRLRPTHPRLPTGALGNVYASCLCRLNLAAFRQIDPVIERALWQGRA